MWHFREGVLGGSGIFFMVDWHRRNTLIGGLDLLYIVWVFSSGFLGVSDTDEDVKGTKKRECQFDLFQLNSHPIRLHEQPQVVIQLILPHM